MRETEYLGDLGVNGRILLKWILTWMCGLGLGYVPGVHSFWHCIEASGSVKGREFVEQLKDYQFPKHDSAPW